MIKKVMTCDLCEMVVGPDPDAFRLRFTGNGRDGRFVLEGLFDNAASEKIICKRCCITIVASAAKWREEAK